MEKRIQYYFYYLEKFLPTFKIDNKKPVFVVSGLLLCVDNVEQFYFKGIEAGELNWLERLPVTQEATDSSPVTPSTFVKLAVI